MTQKKTTPRFNPGPCQFKNGTECFCAEHSTLKNRSGFSLLLKHVEENVTDFIWIK